MRHDIESDGSGPQAAGAPTERPTILVGALSRADQDEWDRVASSSDDAWVGHERRWNELVEEGVWAARPASLVIRLGRRVVGIVPLHVTERRLGPLARRILWSNYWGPGGPALVPDLDERDRARAIAAAARAVHALARELRVDKLLVRLPVVSRRALGGLRTADPLEGFGTQDASTASTVIRLGGRTADDAWASMEGRARTEIRKAQRAGVRVRDAVPDEVVERYYDLHLTTYRRTGATPHPRAYFETILRSPWSRVLFAEHHGAVVAALNVGIHRDTAFYWTGASRDEARSLGANSLLQWHALRSLAAEGCVAYELGELPGAHHTGRRSADAKLAALARFKTSFGGEALPYRRAVCVYSPVVEGVLAAGRRIASGLRA